MADLISTNWKIETEGYVWADCRPPLPHDDAIDYTRDPKIFEAGLYLVPKALTSLAEYVAEPEQQNIPDDLFQTFARLYPSHDVIQRFANTYGNLGGNTEALVPIESIGSVNIASQKSLRFGTSLKGWIREIETMRIAVDLWTHVNNKNPESLHSYFHTLPIKIPAKRLKTVSYFSYFFLAPVLTPRIRGVGFADISNDIKQVKSKSLLRAAKGTLVNIINQRISGNLKPLLHFSHDTRKVSFRISADSLISSLWLQFAQAISQDRAYKQCEACGKWFDVSNKLGARVDKKWCSEACKKRMYRQRIAEKSKLTEAMPKSPLR